MKSNLLSFQNFAFGIMASGALSLAGCNTTPKDPIPVADSMQEHSGYHLLGAAADIRSDIEPSPHVELKGFTFAPGAKKAFTLNLDYHDFTVGNQKVRLRTYEMPGENDESIVGPVIRVDRTEEVSVQINNNLTGPDTVQYWFLLDWPNAELTAELAKPSVSEALNKLLDTAQAQSLWGEALRKATTAGAASRIYDQYNWPENGAMVGRTLTEVVPGQQWSFPLTTTYGIGQDTIWQLVKSYNVATSDTVLKVFRGVPQVTHANHNVPHGFNTTNFHTHGWHVSPKQDNIYRQIHEGEASLYEYTLTNHPAGSFWYHPHVHGSTAIQVASGASGALIVNDGDLSGFPELKTATENEEIMVINQILFHPEVGELSDFETMKSIFLTMKKYPALKNSLPGTTINGVTTPILELEAGVPARYRFIESGFKNAEGFYVPDGIKAYQISVDGLYFTEPREIKSLHLAPGNRSDIIFVADAVDAETTLNFEAISYLPQCEYFADSSICTNAPTTSLGTLFQIKVQPGAGNGVITSADFALPTNDIPEPDPNNIDTTRNIQFSISGSSFMVNGEPFVSPTNINQWVRAGSTDRWIIDGRNGGHPYHIHVNPFKVIKYGVRKLETPIWKDVVYVQSNGSINNIAEMLTYYAPEYPGQFVLHCHILDHEDQGMMQNVSVHPPNFYPACVPDTVMNQEYNRTRPTTESCGDGDMHMSM